MFGTLHQSATDNKSFSLLQVKSNRDDGKAIQLSDILVTDTELKAGDLLRVFKSIKNGDQLLKADIHYEMDKKYYQEYPKNIDRALWTNLFHMRLPAQLQKPDGTVVEGVLEPFSEQGMEGRVMWAIYDFDNKSYASLHSIDNDDVLTVFSAVKQGNIEWQGRIELEDKPFETGKNITLVSFDQDEDSIANFQTRQVKEVIAKTYISPSLQELERWSIRNLPAQMLH